MGSSPDAKKEQVFEERWEGAELQQEQEVISKGRKAKGARKTKGGRPGIIMVYGF